RRKEALYNLLDNAVKYSREHGEIRLMARQRDEEIVLSVTTMASASAKKTCRAFSSVSTALTKRAAPKAFAAPVSASRSSNTSRNSTAVTSKPRAKSRKDRRV